MALSTTHTFALHKINEKEYIKVFKKVKKILPILLAMVMLFGSCLSVFAAEYSEIDLTACSSMMTYAINHGYPQYKYQTYMYANGYAYLVCSDKPLYGKMGSMGSPYVYGSEGTSYYWLSYVNDSPNVSTKPTLADNTVSFIGLVADDAHLISNYDMECIYSNATQVRWNAKESFFPKPPVAVAALTLEETVPSQIKVILTIAIGLLALLTILSVLPKKLPLFLKQ